MSQADVSLRLGMLGWPVDQPGVTRTENGDRQVDVDDLVALAIVLGVSPNVLLLPETTAPLADLDAELWLTPGCSATLGRAWAWASGEQGLTIQDAAGDAGFVLENKPHRFTLAPPPATGDHPGMHKLVQQAIAHGMTTWQLRTIFEQALARAATEHGTPL